MATASAVASGLSRIFVSFMLFYICYHSSSTSSSNTVECFTADTSSRVNNDRSKRALLFPRTGPTRVQLIAGFGLPVVDLELESLTIGYVYKAQYFMPENVSNYINILADPFSATPKPISGRRRRRSRRSTSSINDQPINLYQPNEKYEKYTVEVNEIDSGLNNENTDDNINNINESDKNIDEMNDEENNMFSLKDLNLKSPQSFVSSRFVLYKGLETLADATGIPGRSCLLRSICETVEAPFSWDHGILGELAHLIMTPSTTEDELHSVKDNDYLNAEKLGHNGSQECERVFKECTTSFLNMFSTVFDTINLFG